MTSRSSFRTWGAILSAILAGVAYCAMTWQWSALVRVVLMLGLGFLAGTHAVALALKAHSRVWLVPLLVVILAAATWQHHRTRTQNWHERVGAVCRDGWRSRATGSGACSHHGGVRTWRTREITRALETQERWEQVLGELWFLIPLAGAVPTLLIEPLAFRARARRGYS